MAVTALAATGSVLADGPAAAAATVAVERGQTLTGVAAELHTTVAALVAANDLADPNLVLAGQVLQVPSPGGAAPGGSEPGGAGAGDPSPGSVVIVVARGDTLTSIAARYRTTVAAIAAVNGIGNVNRVLAGSRLHVPLAAASGMQLTSYGLPNGSSTSSSSYPAQLLAHPSRLSLAPGFTEAAAASGVPLSLLEALCWWESGWQPSVISATGAVGVCQVEPSTAAYVNRVLLHRSLDPHVAAENISLAAAYLASLLRATGGDVSQAVAGYYQGLASVRHRGMLPSTAVYVHGIEAYAAIFAG